MAARLMWRASRLLAVPVSFQPSVPSECVRLCQLVPSLPLQAPLHTSSLCRQVESVPEISENPENSENTGEDEFFVMLNGLPGIEEVLSVVESQKLDVNKCVMVIIQLAKRRAENFQYLHDRRFIKLLEKINRQVHSIWNGRLIRLLKNLYLLGLDNKNHCYKSVEIEVRWRLRKLSMASLGQLASYVARQPQNPESKLLLEDVAKEVELRGTEITDTLTLSLLISSLGVLPENLMERLEDKVLEFASQFKPNESRRILLAMAFQNRRSLPVLRALSHTLAQEKLTFSTGVLVDVAFSLSRLNFSQLPLFNKLCQDFVSLMPKISPSDSSMFLRSIGLLRFPYPPVCEAVAQAFLDGKEFSSIHLCSIILSFARFNFLPSQSEQFFNLVHKKLLPSFDLLPWSKRVELVWSLCILGQATPSFLLKILDSEQVKTLSGNADYLRSSLCYKLLNINATAILESPDHWGFLLPDDLIQTILTVNHGFPTTSMQKNIRDVLKMVFPDPETCNLNVKTTYGWTLDADVILDAEYNPLPLKKFVAPHLPVSEGTEPLPEDARRFAVVAREFSHYLTSRKDLLGMFLMFHRQMRAVGFLVVEVPYYEWVELKSDFQKQSYLKDQFRKVVAQEMAQLEA